MPRSTSVVRSGAAQKAHFRMGAVVSRSACGTSLDGDDDPWPGPTSGVACLGEGFVAIDAVGVDGSFLVGALGVAASRSAKPSIHCRLSSAAFHPLCRPPSALSDGRFV